MIEAGAGSFRSALRHRGFGRFIVAVIVSSVGDFVNSVALLVVIYRETGSAGWLGAVAVLRVLGWAGSTAIGGVVSDRYDRRRLLVALNIVAAAVTFAITLAASVEGPVLVLVALSMVLDVVAGFANPATAAAVPAIVGEADVAAANASVTTVEQVSMVAGPAVGAVLVAAFSPEVAFACNAVSYLIAAILFVGVPAGGNVDEDEPPARFRDGVDVVRGSRASLVLISIFVGAVISYGFSMVLFLLVAHERLGMDESGVGYLRMAEGIGGIAAALVAGRIAASSSPSALVLGALVSGAAPMVLAVTRSPAIAFAALAVGGAAYVILEVVVVSWLQRITPDEFLGRVMGLLMSLGAIGTAIGAGLAPILVEALSLEWAIVLGGAVTLVVIAALSPAVPALARSSASRRRTLEPVIEALRSLDLFSASDDLALERLAGAIEDVRVPCGAVVLRQGDAPDDLYVVRTGIFDVRAADQPDELPKLLSVVGPGQWFGELGLIRQSARSATVTASTDAELWRIPGEVFLAAYTPPAPRSDILRNGTLAYQVRSSSGNDASR